MRSFAIFLTAGVLSGLAFTPSLAAQPFPPGPPVIVPLPAPAPHPAPPFRMQLFGAAPQPGGSYLGVGVMEISPQRARELGMDQPSGVEVTSVEEGSPADKADLQKRDVVLEFRGQEVLGVEHFIRLVRETPVGRQVEMKVLREGQSLNLSAEIGRHDPSKGRPLVFCEDGEPGCMELRVPDFRFRLDFDLPKPNFSVKNRSLGVEMESLDGQLAEYFGVEEGVLVRAVDADSPAERAGLRAGDVLVSVAGKSIRETKDVREALRTAASGEKIPLEVMRNKTKQTLQLELGSEETGEGSRRRGVRRTGGQRL